MRAVCACLAVFSMLAAVGEGVPTKSGDSRVSKPATRATDLQSLFTLGPDIAPLWEGGDVATSIPRKGGGALWLFGDTLLGKARHGRRKTIEFMPHSSLGQVGSPRAHWPPALERLDWDMDGSGRPRSLFHPKGSPECDSFPTMMFDCEYYWVTSGLESRDGKHLLLTALRIRNLPPHEVKPGGFAFEVMASDLISVHNPEEPDPRNWRYKTAMWPGTGKHLNFASAMTWTESGGDHMYILGSTDKANVLAKATFTDLFDQNFEALHYWSDTKWRHASHSGVVDELTPLFEPTPQPETSLVHYPGWGWFSLSIAFASTEIRLMTAPEVVGPWSATDIYSIPAPLNDTSRFFAYAPKLHPELAVKGREALSGDCGSAYALELVATFMTNSMNGSDLMATSEAYTPQFLRLVVCDQGGGAATDRMASGITLHATLMGVAALLLFLGGRAAYFSVPAVRAAVDRVAGLSAGADQAILDASAEGGNYVPLPDVA